MNDGHKYGTAHDPVAEDIASRNPATDDIVAGEQVLDGDVPTGQRPVSPHPDDFRGEGATPRHRAGDSAGRRSARAAEASTREPDREPDGDRAGRHA